MPEPCNSPHANATADGPLVYHGRVTERAFEEEPGRESYDRPASPLFIGLSVATALVLLAVLGVAVRPALGGRARAGVSGTSSALGAPPALASPPTFVYVVGSVDDAAGLQRAFDDFDRDVAAQGRPVGLVRHIVVAQTPQDVLLQRAFDFSYLPTAGHGQDIRVIDLR
jgi:hypothetical protein